MKYSDEHLKGDVEFDTPKELLDDLSALYSGEVSVPPDVDRAVMAMARERLSPQMPPRLVLRWKWAAATVATAAVVVLVCIMSTRERDREPHSLVSQPIKKEDFDGNGEVDILDAFALARHIESTRTPNEKWDINGDGTVDRRDVDRIAMAAVSLKRGT